MDKPHIPREAMEVVKFIREHTYPDFIRTELIEGGGPGQQAWCDFCDWVSEVGWEQAKHIVWKRRA